MKAAILTLTQTFNLMYLNLMTLTMMTFTLISGPATLSAAAKKTSFSHPLDPLSKVEIERSGKCVKTHPNFPKDGLFPIVVLKEPSKPEIKAHTPGKAYRREALIVILDRKQNKTVEAVCDLNQNKVIDWKEIKEGQPLVLVEEYAAVPVIVKQDLRWQEAMKRRGITDFNRVQVDTWAAGTLVPEPHKGKRLLKGISYLKDKDMNFYGRPIEGVLALVDMNEKKVLELVDTGIIPIAEKSAQFDTKTNAPIRKDLKPLKISQPKGASYRIQGNEIHWQKWRFRYTLHPREGLVLYTVGYEDKGKLRSVLYRASVSEMVVPYGDPDSNWSWRNAFDAGEYGVGRLAAPLEVGKDTPDNAQLLDVDFADDFGKAYTAPRSIGIYERDGGMLWKHYDLYSNKSETRRARELVLAFVAAIGNYDYAFKWIFSQDGGIRLETDLTGIMLPKGVATARADQVDHSSKDSTGHGLGAAHLVAPYIACPHHQHFFNFRLDMDVDGESNSLEELNTYQAEKGKDNPTDNAIRMELVPLKSENAAARDVSQEQARKWRIYNPNLKTALGYHPGYILLPEDNAFPYAGKDSAVRKRARFIDHQFWTTQYKEEEMSAAGPYPNQNPRSEGLIKWISDDESLEKQDLVLWYTLGITHVPRPEEWPVMPVAHLGFKIWPAAFFTENPAMDLP